MLGTGTFRPRDDRRIDGAELLNTCAGKRREQDLRQRGTGNAQPYAAAPEAQTLI